MIKNSNSIFSGIGVAIVTPFDDKNNFDKDAVFQLAENLINNNISYVVVQGTTGESSTLEINEKKIVNKTYIDAFKNKVPLILEIGRAHV